MKIKVVIPARYGSSRFPGKPLASILGKPMIQWVFESASAAVGCDNTFVATDDSRIYDTVRQFGGQSIMTSNTHKTGTDRLAEVAQTLEADLYVNVQGDEPLVSPVDIQKVVKMAMRQEDRSIVNAYCPILSYEDALSYNFPKVIVDRLGFLLYMSRAALPYCKDEPMGYSQYKRQVCIYGFYKEHLDFFRENPEKSEIEKQEDIEILRFLEHGFRVKMVAMPNATTAVDVPSDIAAVENELSNRIG